MINGAVLTSLTLETALMAMIIAAVSYWLYEKAEGLRNES